MAIRPCDVFMFILGLSILAFFQNILTGDYGTAILLFVIALVAVYGVWRDTH